MIRPRIVAILLALGLGLVAQPALADGADGKWTGDVAPTVGCDYASRLTLIVAGGEIFGQISKANGTLGVTGTIVGEGGTILVDDASRGTVHLSGDHLLLDWRNNACARHAEIQRDPGPPGRFDGLWWSERLGMGKPCNASTYIDATVSGDTVMGELHAPWHNANFSATIGADGTGTLNLEGARGSVRFHANSFQMAWVGGRCGSEVALGDRAPDAARQQAMLQIRQQNQQALKALIDRAERGDATVDYTALRTAAIYADDWAFYNNKAQGPMQLAADEAKGGDCPQALDNLDLTIRYDFTIDSAHALKADCLRKSNPAKAKIDDAIANGLVRSLMRSGDGAREKTAYVVTTGREIADVLANRKIQIKTLQHEVRGSDGHYYSVVQGLSVDKKGNHVRSVYFNVDAFVTGRQSRRVAQMMNPPTVR